MGIWGIDLGGTKIEGAILKSINNPEVVCRKRIPTEANKGYDHVINQIQNLVALMEKETGEKATKIGMGTPGTIDPDTGLLKNSNSTVLNHQPFKKDVEAKLGIPVLIANDANCFALAEARMGVVQDINPNAKVVFGVIMGTGVGGGIIINNQVLEGRQGIGGEWGHSFLDESGGKCYCGNVGCVEKILSGTALEKYHEDISGVHVPLREIYHRYNIGHSDEFAVKTMHRLIHFFGKGLANVINILDPDVIVIGGGVGNIDLLYSDGIESVSRFVFNTQFKTPVVKPKLGDSAGVFGAAFLIADT